jgi:formate dehydrogenase accessory protein FdhE
VSRIPWDARAARAAALAERLPSSADILTFYQRVLAAQGALYREVALLGAPALELPLIERYFPPFVDCVQRGATSALVERSAEILNARPASWLELIEAGDEFFAQAFLQPWAEAHYGEPVQGRWDIAAVCPCCGRAPQLAVLREMQHGARRDLICSLCSWEWEFRRILCPACGEDRFEKLPVFKTDAYPALRVESCETCSTYILSADMTLDGTVVPLVDEAAAVTLHLWARDEGLRRLQPNLFGV